MTNDINRTIAEFDGFIFSGTGGSARRGVNGPVHVAKNIKYDSYNRLMPVYRKVREVAFEMRENEVPGKMFTAVQQQLLFGTVDEFRQKIYEFVKWLNENKK